MTIGAMSIALFYLHQFMPRAITPRRDAKFSKDASFTIPPASPAS